MQHVIEELITTLKALETEQIAIPTRADAPMIDAAVGLGEDDLDRIMAFVPGGIDTPSTRQRTGPASLSGR